MNSFFLNIKQSFYNAQVNTKKPLFKCLYKEKLCELIYVKSICQIKQPLFSYWDVALSHILFSPCEWPTGNGIMEFKY